ncbi:hypothetical protein T05_13327 [Trichinella murrelli]|uniref:Uncharacterized protein n=1 Tax=Trichinella murrelli TaxID=144512 RepID=A0A0V0T6C3_9BILA|nr:hypothetical protein T05_13327 [Trichinella murrelli]
MVVGVADRAFKKQLRHQLSFYGVPFALGSMSHFVLNVASQTSVSIEFAPDCSWIVQCLLNCFQLSFALNTVLSHVHINVASQTSVIGYVKRAHFIHDSITLTSSEFDVSSDGPLS